MSRSSTFTLDTQAIHRTFLNIATSVPSTLPQSDQCNQFGMSPVITFAVYTHTHIYVHKYSFVVFSHKWNCTLFFKLPFAFKSMSYKLLCISEYTSMTQYPEILNYMYFPQCPTLLCAPKAKHLLFLQGASIL